MCGDVPPLGYIFPVCCITTHGNFELLSGALDEITRLVFLAKEMRFKYDDDDDSVHVY